MMLRIKAFTLLVLFSFSALGNAFEVHYCKGEIIDISLVGEDPCVMSANDKSQKKCHAAESKQSCHKKKKHENNLEKAGCCETEAFSTLGTTAFKPEGHVDVLSAVVLTLFYPYTLFESESKTEFTIQHPEPDLSCDWQVIFQTFLI